MGPLEGLLGVLGDVLRISWSLLGPSGANLARLGPSWAVLGASWGRPGAIWGRFEGVLGTPWAVLEASWAVLGASSSVLGASWALLAPKKELPRKNTKKTRGFRVGFGCQDGEQMHQTFVEKCVICLMPLGIPSFGDFGRFLVAKWKQVGSKIES